MAPPICLYIYPQVTSWTIRQELLGVFIVNLYLPIKVVINTIKHSSVIFRPVPPDQTDHHLVIRPLPQSLTRKVHQPGQFIQTIMAGQVMCTCVS